MRISELCTTCVYRHSDNMKWPCNICNPEENKYKEASVEEQVFIELETALKKHDWTYHFSDDHRYWSRGNEQEKRIKFLMTQAKAIDEERAIKLYEEYAPKW